jgi:hypothetical protein
MECCVHDLPPTPPTEKNLSLLCRNVCDARHKNHRAVLRPERTRRGAPPTRIHSAMCGQSSAYGRATAAKSDQPGRNSSGSLAMLAAMRRASSRTSAWIARLAQALALCAQQRSSFLTSFSALIPSGLLDGVAGKRRTLMRNAKETSVTSPPAPKTVRGAVQQAILKDGANLAHTPNEDALSRPERARYATIHRRTRAPWPNAPEPSGPLPAHQQGP